MADKDKASVLTEISHVISSAAESMNKSVQDWADKSKQKDWSVPLVILMKLYAS